MPLRINPILAFKDNYIWLLTAPENNQAVVVDPGDAAPVLAILKHLSLKLAAILITHHHRDHSGGILKLTRSLSIPVFGPAKELVEGVTHSVSEGDFVVVNELKLKLKVLNIPGHTLGHIAYYGHGVLFCGDTLFTGGCGRLFEGTAEQLYDSLNKLADLPDETKVYCGHEYTQSNLRFAKVVEPNNIALLKRAQDVEELRAQGTPTVPSTIGEEKQTNPFLRCHTQDVVLAAEHYSREKLKTTVDIFSSLRKWKNEFVS